MIFIDTPKAKGENQIKTFHIISDFPGREGLDELQEFLGRIGIGSESAVWFRGGWNQHARAIDVKYDEALAAGGQHLNSADLARLLESKRPSKQEKSKKKPLKKEIEHERTDESGTDCGPADN